MLRFEGARINNGGFLLQADLTIPAGARVAVIGPSGAGKSTLIGAIAGFVPIESGHLTWQGDDITDVSPGARPAAMLFQDGNLFPHLDVSQNVGLGLRPDLRLDATDRQTVARALDRVGLNGLATRRPAELSGGQQSRVALARVLVQKRPLVLLDEPFAALGPALKADMLDLVAALVAEADATLLMVSHDPGDARRIADLTIVVAEGRADPPQPTIPLLDNPPQALRAYLGAPEAG